MGRRPSATTGAGDSRNNNTYEKLLECVTLEGAGKQPGSPARRLPTTARTRSTPAREPRAPSGMTSLSLTSPGCSGMPGTTSGWTRSTPRSTSRRSSKAPPVGRASTRLASHRKPPGDRPLARRPPGRHQPHPAAGLDQWLRGRRLHGNRLERNQRHRSRPTWGTCFFGTKAYYAEQAGAEAIIIFNQGNTPDRGGTHRGRRHERGPADPRRARTGHARHPGARGRRVSPTGRPSPSRARPRSSRCSPPRPARTSTSSRSCRARTRTTSSWPAPTSTALSRARESTTTAPVRPRCSRRH